MKDVLECFIARCWLPTYQDAFVCVCQMLEHSIVFYIGCHYLWATSIILFYLFAKNVFFKCPLIAQYILAEVIPQNCPDSPTSSEITLANIVFGRLHNTLYIIICDIHFAYSDWYPRAIG